MNFQRFIMALENGYSAAQEAKEAETADQPAKVTMTPEQRERLGEKRAKRSGSLEESAPQGVSQGSITDFEETENIEFHEDGHSSGIEDTDISKPAKAASEHLRFTPSDARKGFIYSEILGKPLSMRRK